MTKRKMRTIKFKETREVDGPLQDEDVKVAATAMLSERRIGRVTKEYITTEISRIYHAEYYDPTTLRAHRLEHELYREFIQSIADGTYKGTLSKLAASVLCTADWGLLARITLSEIKKKAC